MTFPRRLEPELMDQPGLGRIEHEQALAGLARINAWSNSAGIIWPLLQSLAIENKDEKLSVLDLACGGGDILCRLVQRAETNKLNIEWHGADISETGLDYARRHAQRANVTIDFFQADALAAPLARQFDMVLCSLFLHHLNQDQAVALLQNMQRAARRLAIVNDLRRCRAGLALAWAGTRLLSRSPIVHSDGLRSVRGAWTMDEAAALARIAELPPVRLTPHWPFRWRMAWNPK